MVIYNTTQVAGADTYSILQAISYCVSFISHVTIFAIMIPATAVIITIARNRDLINIITGLWLISWCVISLELLVMPHFLLP